jgi:mRNA-degrading endonuclease RelE of RelBE toxin-antitoxin system
MIKTEVMKLPKRIYLVEDEKSLNILMEKYLKTIVKMRKLNYRICFRVLSADLK